MSTQSNGNSSSLDSKYIAPVTYSADAGAQVPGAVSPSKLSGIRGWLIIPAIGIAIYPFSNLFAFLVMVFGLPEFSNAEIAGAYRLELAFTLGIFFLAAYTAILFFRKKRRAPKAFISLLVATNFSVVIVGMYADSVGAKELMSLKSQQLGSGFIFALIWIIYFLVSKRVKATFVK